MDTMLTYNTNSKTGPVCGGRTTVQDRSHREGIREDKNIVIFWHTFFAALLINNQIIAYKKSVWPLSPLFSQPLQLYFPHK